MRGLLLLLVILYPLTLDAQQYRFHQYRVEHGLPSDVIKAVVEDRLGFLWIATDDGLVKYDGISFRSYKDALRSPFAKGFVQTKSGRLLLFSDLDLVEIDNQIDTVIFRTVVKGERFETDSTMSYPKSIYEDGRGGIWLGEPKSVIRLDGGHMKRYDFGEQNRSPVFVRSFSFFEDAGGNLFATAYNGNVFRYNGDSDKFIQQEGLQLPDEVSHVLFNGRELFIAAREGLFVAAVTGGEVRNVRRVLSVPGVSYVTLAGDSSVIVSTYGPELYRVRSNPTYERERFTYDFNGINHSYVSSEGDIWVSTDKGLVVVQHNIFGSPDPESRAHFIEGITDEDGNLYYATKETLVRLSPSKSGWTRTQILEGNANYFQSLAAGEAGLWAATSWNVLLLRNGDIVRRFDFSADGNFVHHVFVDSQQCVWLSQAGTTMIKCIDPSFNVRRYRVEGLGNSEINYIEEGQDGLYAAATGIGTYLFFKAHSDSVFRNISVPIDFDVRGDFNIANVAVAGREVWLASSEGLLRFDGVRLERQNRGQSFERFPVTIVKSLDSTQVLFANSFGLFRYDPAKAEYWLYDEDSGLPSNTITDHGIYVGPLGIWIGTSFGIARAARDITTERITRTPYCVEARINGISARYADGLRAAFGSYITLQFSPVTFPENKISYQWRMDTEQEWRALDHGLLSFSEIEEGEHMVYVRAKKNTGLSWSKPASLSVNIDPPYWKKPEFVFLVIMLAILIAWGSWAMSSSIMNRRREYLEEQISERTQELKKANEELTLRNTELDRFVYSASHDLSAPLKSILGLIRVAKLDNPDDVHRQYLDMMEKSVYKLEDFIEEVVTYSRNTRMPLRFEPIEFRLFVQNILQDHQYSPGFGSIRFVIEDDTGEEMISDLTRMKIVLNNLISNAIKFHWIADGRAPFVRIALSRHGEFYQITVADNGRGIKDEHLKRIFDMFYRASDEAQGSGLGLYILKEAVLKLGGSVVARSTIDEGTEFIVRLPVPQTTGAVHA